MTNEESRPGQGDSPEAHTSTPDSDSTSANALRSLFDEHRRELVQGSAIDPDVIRERGYRSVSRPSNRDHTPREELERLGFPTWATKEDRYYPGIHMPHWSPRGEKRAGQWKPRVPVPNRDGKKMKYASAKGQAVTLDVHPRWTRDRGLDDPALLPAIRDMAIPLWITEGVKKADSLTSRGACTVGLSGVYNWRSASGTLGDWEDVQVRGREVTICFDADALTKPQVLKAMRRLGKWLRVQGAAEVLYVVPPVIREGVKGVDDYFAAGGTLEALQDARTTACPRGEVTEDTFTDARLAETVADGVLEGQYCWTTGLGWLAWDGVRWAEASEAEVTEAVRRYVVSRYMDALDEEKRRAAAGDMKGNQPEIDGWYRVQSAARIANVLRLARGVAGVLRDAGDFDAAPDLLNTPDGVLDLATGEMKPHDPELLITKVTGVAYRPGAHDPAFKAALESVPVDALDWLQIRLGQAATGHMPDDERAVLLTGGGSNGKTTLMDTVFRALGGYAAAVPNSLLLTGRTLGGATPEKMTIRGVRLAYIEETPEGRYLDTQALKEVVGTPTVTGRELYKGFVTFGATHSLLLNTNHLPRVSETDHGTWRRLVRVDFPYRYLAPGSALEREGDRHGDPTLKPKLATREAREAALAWLVDGARRWYDAGRALPNCCPDPLSVVDATKAWRHQSDLILRFLDECTEFDRDAWVTSQGLYAHFKEWATGQGHREIPQNLFIDRMKSHTALPAYVTVRRVRTQRPGLSAPWTSQRPTTGQAAAVIGIRYRDTTG